MSQPRPVTPTPSSSLRHLAVAALFALAACGSEKAQSTTSEPAATPPAAAAQAQAKAPAPGEADGAKAAPGGPVKTVDGPPPSEKDRYVLAIEPPKDAKVGQAVQVKVKVTPKDPWHMNLEFPTSLAVEAPAGVELAKPKLAKADATKLDESSCEFDLAFTPKEAGEKAFKGTFKFAVCQDEACSPVTEDVTFAVNVVPAS